MVKNSEELYKEKISIFLLFFGLVIMLISFIFVNLFFVYVLHITWDYFISGFWILSIIPLMLYFSYFQKKKYLSFADIGLKRSNVTKSILFGVVAGIITGLIGWLFLSLFCPPVEPISNDVVVLFLFVSVISAPIKEEIMFRGILWAFLDKSAVLILKNKKKNFDTFKKDIVIIIVISFAFLFVHIGRNIETLLTKFLFDSFVFSIIYYKTRNLLTPIIAHSISNLLILFRPFIG